MLRIAANELHGSYSKRRLTSVARRLVPAARSEDLVSSYAGIRAQPVGEGTGS